MDKKLLLTVDLHSTIDLITNSSTEIFCTVNGKSEDAVQSIINKVLREFGCECCIEMSVSQHENWENGGDGEPIPGKFDISYEQQAPPCKMIEKRIKELLANK